MPIELVKPCSNDTSILYHCYLIELNQNFAYDIPVHDIVLGMRSELDCDIAKMHFDLEVGKGTLTAKFIKGGELHLDSEQVMLSLLLLLFFFKFFLDNIYVQDKLMCHH